jgi:hypothetical protein
MQTTFAKSVGRRLLVGVVALLVLFGRRPDAFFRPQFWAEDFVFLTGAEKVGFASFARPQAGYLHFIPRLIAWPATWIDPAWQPALFVAGWLAVALTIVYACLSPRHTLPLKPWLAAAVLLVPHSGEVFFTPTNAQWAAALGLLLTLAKVDPVRASDWLADLGILFFAGLSGPFIIFAVPLFAFRAVQRKTAASRWLAGVALALAGTQGWFIGHEAPDREFVGPFAALGLCANVCFRLPGNLFFGALLTGTTSKVIVIALGAGVLGFVGFAAFRSEQHRATLGSFLGFVVLLLTCTTLRKRFDLWGYGDIANGDRYFFIPKVVLLWTVGIVFATQRVRWIKWAAGTLMVSSLACNAPRFQFTPLKNFGWYERCPEIRAGHEIEITINPGWKFRYQRGSHASAGPI